MTSSRKRTAVSTVAARRLKSKVPSRAGPTTKLARLTEPRLQGSQASSGCSPQGLVASIWPMAGVGLEPDLLMRSMTINPGSPDFQAHSTMSSKISLARARPVTSLVRGLTRSYSASAATAFMNFSSMATETLKFSMIADCDFMVMKSLISGWL